VVESSLPAEQAISIVYRQRCLFKHHRSVLQLLAGAMSAAVDNRIASCTKRGEVNPSCLLSQLVFEDASSEYLRSFVLIMPLCLALHSY
jgi:hypothetical protein